MIHNGIEALVAIGKQPPDLMVLDVVMPVVDGATVCATLRSHPEPRRIKILAVSGKKLTGRVTRFIRSKSDGFFRKP